MFLGKGLKYMLDKVLPYTYPGILDYKPVICNPVFAGSLLYLYQNGTIRSVIFNGIFDNIHQDLFEVQRIPVQSAMFYAVLVKLKLNPSLLRLDG